MFDGIVKEYERSKKTVEKENGNACKRGYINEGLYLVDILRKELKNMSEQITKKILASTNSVKDFSSLFNLINDSIGRISTA